MLLVFGTTLLVILVWHPGLVVAKRAPSKLNSTLAQPGSHGSVDNNSKEVDCIHGKWLQLDNSAPGKCICDTGWRRAGLSDPVNFWKGKCSQYMCHSNLDCNLEFPGSTCDVSGWNCNCGWQRASSFLGGDETKHAKCMGSLYYASDYICTNTLRLMKWMWKPILAFMACAFFFGEKQVRCECYNRKQFKLARSLWMGCFGLSRIECDGGCVHRRDWDASQDWSYEFSWSIYFFDLGLWAYAFLVVLFLTGLVAGSILALACVILALVLAAISALIMCICGGEGGGDMGGGDACNCHELCGNGGECCDGCCTDCGPTLYSPSYGTDFLLWGPQPTGSSCDCCTCRCCGDGRCDCCPRLWLCRPLTWVLVRFPEIPSNMWGGCVGRLMGTHHFTREEHRYRGGKWWIDMLSFRTVADLHSDSNWRQRVYDFVFVDGEPDVEGTPQQMRMNVIGRAHQQSARRPNFIRGKTNVAVKLRDPWGPFTVEHDSCQRSTFEDYCTGTCWLCCENRCEKFHMWVQCGHIFCSDCSAAMMQRSMPCPLCRKVSTTIVEGPRALPPDAASDINSD